VKWVHVIIDIPPERAGTSTRFWAAVLGWPVGEAWSEQPNFRSFEPPEGDPYVHRQIGDHGPRIHLDFEVDDMIGETERLRGLGATVGDRRDHWQVLESPGGLPFCLLQRRPRTQPGPVGWAGHRSRLVQVCIDSPPDQHDDEVWFWRAATGGHWVPGEAPEFAGKLYPTDGPVQLLLQRLGPDTSGPTRAHIDIGSDDIDAEVTRVVSLGAERLWPGEGWYALRDPTGLVFCVTGNSPDAAVR
jgi:glyoxalase superfamily protein